MLIHPSPNPVITITSAPTTWPMPPSGRASTAARSMVGAARTMYTTVTTPVIHVSTDCSRMIVW
ncbi:Uncharacterised protein [Mycobacterium tuberculosis]|nr:Uncharacterised protein [Mycobacterium tuberculosis]